ncbi:hypothetical protein N5K55_05725 [Pseudomonas aeruginosa]|nr:hypothetical protein [Pseudomonas aeruginosa]
MQSVCPELKGFLLLAGQSDLCGAVSDLLLDDAQVLLDFTAIVVGDFVSQMANEVTSQAPHLTSEILGFTQPPDELLGTLQPAFEF